MKHYSIVVFCVFLLQSCSDNSANSSPTSAINTPKADSFFPVTSFLKGQLIILDSLPITPLQLTTVQQKTDSVWISKNRLNDMLQPFINDEISSTNLNGFFKETKFNDQTLNAVTFTYDPVGTVPDSVKLRHWDVYIHPETGKVTKVYMVKQVKERGQLITLQLTWQTDKMAKISTILNNSDGGKQLLKEETLIWDF